MIVFETIFQIKPKLKNIFKSFIILTLFKNFAEDCLSKVVSLKRNNFGIKCTWESMIPFLDKLIIGLGQGSYELIVEVNDVINHVMADECFIWVFLESFDHFFDNQRKA